MCWSRYTEIPPSTSRRLISAMASRSVFSGREIASPSGPIWTCAPNAVPSSRRRARSGSEHSIWTSKEDPASSWEIGPCRITLPRSTMATASQVRSTSSRRCDDSTTVRPSDTRDLIMSRMSSMPAGSRPFIGSSRISSWGSPSRQAATPSRWRMPMEYFDTLSSARCRMPTRSSAGSMRPLAAGSRAAARICRFWRPVRWPWKRGSSTIAPTRARATSRCRGTPWPRRNMVPASAWVRPSSTLISVVLPAPFGPR